MSNGNRFEIKPYPGCRYDVEVIDLLNGAIDPDILHELTIRSCVYNWSFGAMPSDEIVRGWLEELKGRL